MVGDLGRLAWDSSFLSWGFESRPGAWLVDIYPFQALHVPKFLETHPGDPVLAGDSAISLFLCLLGFRAWCIIKLPVLCFVHPRPFTRAV